MGEIVTGLEFAASMASPGGKSQRHITEGIAEIKRLQAVNADLVKALELILPMAKGYAAQNNVGSNMTYVEFSVAALSRAKEQS